MTKTNKKYLIDDDTILRARFTKSGKLALESNSIK